MSLRSNIILTNLASLIIGSLAYASNTELTPTPSTQLPVKYYFGYSNKDSRLSWGASYEMMSYLGNYRATRELKHLQDFITYAEFVRGMRDDKQNYNLKGHTWSSTNYSRGIPYATLVGDGMISYPFADFAALVLLHDTTLKTIYISTLAKNLEDLAEEYLQIAKETIEAHSSELLPSGTYKALSSTSSYFLDSQGRSISSAYELPFNMSLAMGRTLVRVAEIEGPSSKYGLAAYKMAGRFMSWISNRSSNPYWVYWIKDANVYEDISHGSIVVDFMRLYLQSGLPGMKWRDVYNLTQTFVNLAYKGAGTVSLDILGQNPLSTPDYRDSISWMMLSNYNNNVKLIGVHAHIILEKHSPHLLQQGYGAWVSSLKNEFGGRKTLNSSCNLPSECASGICRSTSINQVGESEFESLAQSCQSWVPTGNLCTTHFECASALCDFSKNLTLKTNSPTTQQISRLGTCKSKP